jgi:hypothetical protein
MNYLIVLFKNKERKKIINKFKTYERAEKFYNDLISKSNSVRFEVLVENALVVDYELGLLKKDNTDFDALFVKDFNYHYMKPVQCDILTIAAINLNKYAKFPKQTSSFLNIPWPFR